MKTLVISIVVFICSFSGAHAAKAYSSNEAEFKVEIVASGLNHPWGMAKLPDGKLAVTERAGYLRIVDPNTGKSERYHLVTTIRFEEGRVVEAEFDRKLPRDDSSKQKSK